MSRARKPNPARAAFLDAFERMGDAAFEMRILDAHVGELLARAIREAREQNGGAS